MQVSAVSNFFHVMLEFVRNFQKLLSGWRNNKSELGFMMVDGLPREAVESISGYLRSSIVCPDKVLLDVEFFLNCFCTLPYFTTTLITRKTAASLCLPLSLSVSWVPMWFWDCAKTLAVEFPENICWENMAFQEDFCFRTRCSLLSIQLSTFGKSLLWNSSC